LSKIIILAAMILALFSCAEQPVLKNIETPSEGQTVVFGSVETLEDGKPLKWVQSYRLLILPHDESAKALIFNLPKDGSFYWALPPGEYMIAAYEVTKGLTGETISGKIRTSFTVPQGAKSLYIGKLMLLLRKGRYKIGISDNYDEAVKGYRKRFSGASDQPHRELMKLESRLGTFESMKYICAKEWGIECTKKYYGVTPVYPDGAQSGFSEVNSLKPSFKWKPSSNDDVTYDLVIYDAVHFGGSMLEPRYIAGELVAYKEGLKEPEWQPDMPLKPKHNYIWSVRLRHNDVVSNWSTYSHFGFYIVAWTSGYGKWFKFTTPEK
jgi:hypothetical protein